ncbi:hypothetical protein [Pararhodospirillum photometricum]|uniref:hypothetical protein n=1 Tax=Pararhodospirillum photometricum TaxID=1084 RepID=UPI0002FCAFD0|nr:hypothetical protein [Pararhodospirillum photometricum]
MKISHQDLFDRAVAAYARACARDGVAFAQPSLSASHVDGDTVTLANINGPLARYRWAGAKVLRVSG